MRLLSRHTVGLLAAGIGISYTNAASPKIPRQSPGSNQKWVFAHHIVGLTSSYTVDDWKADISLAQANGIDGFALNVGNDDYTPIQAGNAYQAAEQLDSSFVLFFSFDMSSLPCTATTDAEQLRNLTLSYASHPNQHLVDGKAFVSTFAGESCDFGHSGGVPGGWREEYTQQSDIAGRVHFIPSFFIDPATFGQYSGVMDGYFDFNSGWPIALTVAAAPALLPNVDLNNVDATAQAALQQYIGSFTPDTYDITQIADTLGGNSSAPPPTYMAAVSPWFFTHFSPETYNKNWVYDGDEHLWVARWETLIANRDHVDFVEILTWNDFGESSYLGPVHANQTLPPGSDAWVDGFDHGGWLGLTRYFATAFKTGQPPAIENDELVMWARPHPKNATPADPVGAPRDYQLFQDVMWVVVMATEDGELTLSSTDADTETFAVAAGVNKLSAPLTPNGSMRGTLTRNGEVVIDLQPDGFVFNPNPTAYNYNAFVASATSA